MATQLSEDALSLLMRLCEPDAAKRAGIAEARQHRWLLLRVTEEQSSMLSQQSSLQMSPHESPVPTPPRSPTISPVPTESSRLSNPVLHSEHI